MTEDHDAVHHFLTWAQYDRRRSPETLRRYRAVLGQFKDPLHASQAEVEEWWASRLHLAASTRANELACLRAFYRWATRFDRRDDDPTRRLDPPKIPNHVPRAIGGQDLARLLGPLTEDCPDLRRAVALGAYGGLRIAEAAGLDWKDIDQEARRIFVRGKGQKERAVGLSPVLLDLLLPATGGNVVTGGGTPYSAGTLQRRVNRLIADAEIPHTFHDLRKRGATLALSKGLNAAAVRQMFGWASMETVLNYAVVGDEELDRIAAAMV